MHSNKLDTFEAIFRLDIELARVAELHIVFDATVDTQLAIAELASDLDVITVPFIAHLLRGGLADKIIQPVQAGVELRALADGAGNLLRKVWVLFGLLKSNHDVLVGPGTLDQLLSDASNVLAVDSLGAV